MRHVEAVVFDLDGVLLDSETIWDEARRAVVERAGGQWSPSATRDMMGMSSPEWSAYLRDRLGVPRTAEDISADVVRLVRARYRERLPLLPGAVAAVCRLAARWPLGLASSSNRPIIEAFLDTSELRSSFTATVSSEEVARGKPAPDVYLAAADALGVRPDACVAVEDSTNGIRAAVAARMDVVAVPNPHFPPAPDALATARLVVNRLDELTVDAIQRAV